MNKLTVYGRLTTDVDLRTVGKNNVAEFGVAAQNRQKGTDGKYGTNFYRAKLWGATGELAAKLLHKGDRVVVAGDLVIRDYVGNDQQKHYAFEIQNAEFSLVETKAESEAKARAAGTTTATAQFTPVENVAGNDELPF